MRRLVLPSVPAGHCRACRMPADLVLADGLCWGCSDGAANIAPSAGGGIAGSEGPCSNTGQNSLIPKRKGAITKPKKGPQKKGTGHGALVDFLSHSLSNVDELVQEVGEEDFPSKLVAMIFGRDSGIHASDLTGRGWQGYADSATLYGYSGEVIGKFGIGGNGDTAHISLSGAGCACVPNWERVAHGILTTGARITRCDLAFDDYMNLYGFHPRVLDEYVQFGGVVRAPGAGRPPLTRFLDDHGSNKGCTFYAGTKGSKELCIYEKGKEQGDPESDWIRVEVRFFGKHHQLSPSMLTDPLPYLRGAYNICERIPASVTTRAKTVQRKVEANAMAFARWLNTQAGQSIGLLFNVMGSEATEFLRDAIGRPGVPGRFKSFSRDALTLHLRETFNVGRSHSLCPAS
jgi:phage replication initiation protein